MQEVKTDINRSIFSMPSYFATGGMLLIIILGVGTKSLFPENAIKQGLMAYYHAEILFTSLSSDIVLMAVPIICTLPYTTAFLDEYTSGFIKVYLMKCDKSGYIEGKVIAPLVSGGLVLVMGILVFFFLSKLAYLPIEIFNKMDLPLPDEAKSAFSICIFSRV